MRTLPRPRGPLSSALLNLLERDDPSRAPELADRMEQSPVDPDIFFDEDLQLCLFVLYELHYSGFDSVADRWEWNTDLLQLRSRIEERFETRIMQSIPAIPRVEANAQSVAEALSAMVEAAPGRSVADFVARRATIDQVREFLVHKSIYQLKEADPHTWAIPRLGGRAKSALVEIQGDEYGNGLPGRMHSQLFARTMAGLDLDGEFGAYIDRIPAIVLASVNLMSLFGLQRRHRGAICGHLAIYEMTSSLPNAKYARGFRRLGFGAPVTDYFDEHVEADAVHEQIAARDLAGGLVEAEPQVAGNVFLGAAAALLLDGLAGTWQVDTWESGATTLLPAAEVPA
ncbi:iron-containing redox enzyme family protein [Paeniglutamicibacter sp. ABSL32-1]|uniref:iron-containing redox enzyme family protein n=1 Tax=Paeniglutamicibacter quisquiliarum TaxID=2849498 RepID=UPI001C2CF626|nr:iron-containing redox enzyme family protein [Paeniglutamicibacter quisquiliarum]MBV1779761.1 iron-containing redox enzyme family protein [Paeniglutamicibacter quisquiliarum]